MCYYQLEQDWDYYINGKKVPVQEYVQTYLVPKLGIRKINKCIELLEYQGFLACHPECGRARIGRDSVNRKYFELLDYKIRVYFQTAGSVCEFYEAIFF